MRVVVCLVIFLTFISVVRAQSEEEMSSPLYKLQIKELDASAEANINNKENGLLLKDRMQFSSNGFVVQAHEPDRPFSFQISDTVVSFDNLTENHNAQSGTTLSVDANGAAGYQLLALASDLTSSNGEMIEPIGKDNAYGWGYQLLGEDTAAGFEDKKYFRPVDLENWMLLSEKGAALSDRKTELNFKINLPSNTGEVQYVSLIKIIAVPK